MLHCAQVKILIRRWEAHAISGRKQKVLCSNLTVCMHEVFSSTKLLLTDLIISGHDNALQSWIQRDLTQNGLLFLSDHRKVKVRNRSRSGVANVWFLEFKPNFGCLFGRKVKGLGMK